MPRYSEKQKAALDSLMRDDVYKQATAIISAEGLQALTMDRLAKGVGVSRGTLYNYFADRDAVVDFIEDRTFTPLLEAIEAIEESESTPIEKMEAMANEVLGKVCNNLVLVAALSPEKHNPANREAHFERFRKGLLALERTIQNGIDQGLFRDLPAGKVAKIFFGAISGLIDQMIFSGQFFDPDEIVPLLMKLFLNGLRNPSHEIQRTR